MTERFNVQKWNTFRPATLHFRQPNIPISETMELKTANIRLIPRLDVKGQNLVKGVHLEGLKIVGDPASYARKYYEAGADELIYMDIVASLYHRDNIIDIVRKTARDIFIPLTVGGGIRSVDDAVQLLRAGADKVAVNTAATKNPKLIRQLAEAFGSQAVVLSIEAKSKSMHRWEAYTENGRTPTGRDVIEWAMEGVALGAGEILLTSIDQEGTGRGFDLSLIRGVSSHISVPLIVSGGFGCLQDFFEATCHQSGVDGIAIADALHWGKLTIEDIRQFALAHDLPVRKFVR